MKGKMEIIMLVAIIVLMLIIVVDTFGQRKRDKEIMAEAIDFGALLYKASASEYCRISEECIDLDSVDKIYLFLYTKYTEDLNLPDLED